MPSVLRSVVVFSFVSALAIVSAPGCSQQGEGERCDFAKNGSLDCDDGLTCVKKAELQEGVTDRCCPAENTESDSRCARGGPTQTGGSSNGGSSAGTSPGGTANAGESSGGVPGSSGATMSEGGTNGGTPATNDGGTPSAGATTGGAGAGNSASGGQGGAD